MLITTILGNASDEQVAARLHDLEHRGAVEVVRLSQENTRRRRLRVTTDKGTECAIALPRQSALSNGAVLVLDENRAIVVQLHTPQWLRLAPMDRGAALETGYHAGNHHWRVRFDGDHILVAMEGPREDYLARLAPLLEAGKALVVDD